MNNTRKIYSSTHPDFRKLKERYSPKKVKFDDALTKETGRKRIPCEVENFILDSDMDPSIYPAVVLMIERMLNDNILTPSEIIEVLKQILNL